ncbi:MAG: hypothetical protein QXR81_08875 [Candidatus Nezhaarchaeales archaeon]
MERCVLILDFDGVITSLNIDWRRVREEVSRRVGFKVKSIIAFWEKYFGTELFNVANGIVEKYELEAVLNSKPYLDVKQALEWFKGTTYLASMQSERAISLFLDTYDLKKYFKEALSRNAFKSKIEQIRYVLDKEKWREKFILIDDSKRNVVSCQQPGLICFHLKRKTGNELKEVLKQLL